jgi:hypothetical protein
METLFSTGSYPTLYNEDPKPVEIELRECLEISTEDDWVEMARKELGSEKNTSDVLQLQWD